MRKIGTLPAGIIVEMMLVDKHVNLNTFRRVTEELFKRRLDVPEEVLDAIYDDNVSQEDFNKLMNKVYGDKHE